MKAKFSGLLDTLHSSFWFVPALMGIVAYLLSTLTLALDKGMTNQVIEIFGYSRGPDGARLLLSTIAGSVITVAGVTFSITITALSLTSSQLGPRLLRTFMRDTGNQCVLGTFISTFLYCLLILRTINGTENEAFVPHISVTLGLVFAVASVAVLIYFIDHVSSLIQADHVVASASRELEKCINKQFPPYQNRTKRDHADDVPTDALLKSDRPHTITVKKNGYLQAIDIESLIRIATRHDIVLLLEQRPGDFVVHGSTLARYASKTHDHKKLSKHVNDACLIGIQRTPTQDVEFAINQLVEVAIRALSPGINDPFTAMTCIDWLGRACCQMFERTLPSPYYYDKAQTLRVIRPAETFERLIDIAFNQIREASSTNTAVTIRLLETIGRMLVFLRTSTPDSHEVRAILLRHAAYIVHGSQEGISSEANRQMIQQHYQEEIIM